MRAFAGPALLAVALAGCAAPVGDFGRRDSGVYADAMTAVSGPFARPPEGVAAFPYTDEERELRNVGWDLARPPDRDLPGNSLHAFNWRRGLPDGWYGAYPEAYWAAVVGSPVASHETRYQRLVIQARADGQRLPAFRDVASRVGLADGARRGAAEALLADRALRQESERRIAENRAVVDVVCAALNLRIRAYRYALGRLMIETPATRAVEAEAAINGLSWEAGDCGGTLRAAGTAVGGGARGAVRESYRPRGADDAVVVK